MASELNPKQERAIIALLSTSRFCEVALLAGVSDATLRRWMKEPEFKARLRQERIEATSVAVGSLQVAMSVAADTLREVMTDEEQPGAVRVSAAKAVLDAGFKAATVDDLGAQLEELEAMMNAMMKGSNA